MANLKVYPSGFTAYQPSPGNLKTHVARKQIKGWSAHSTRNLIRWLYSLDLTAISEPLHSFSLTLQGCPATPDDWKRLREAFFRRLHHLGITRVQWLTEWQRRGVPHLHGIVILPSEFPVEVFVQQWVCAASSYGALPDAQCTRPIFNAIGWAEYLGKHSARGVSNYQRSSRNIPPGWLDSKTGRMWGKRGIWPTREPLDFLVDRHVFFRLRRLLRTRAISLARARNDPKSIVYSRTMLKHPDPVVSRIRGLSLFSDIEATLRIIQSLKQHGRIQQ